MKSILKLKFHFLFIIFVFTANIMFSQTDTLTSAAGSQDTQPREEQQKKEKKERKRKDEFKVFGGVSFNNLIMDSKLVKPTTAVGWGLGASYKRGKFFYWQVGATYNNSVYNLRDTTLLPGSLFDGVFSVRNVDVPITVGLNFLTFISRIAGLRVYVSAVPAFTLGVGDNEVEVSKDKINTFNIYGQVGVGVDVVFIFVEAGYNYGFIDLFKNDIKSNPNQIFVNLGFRF
jgi:hypothetical protein